MNGNYFWLVTCTILWICTIAWADWKPAEGPLMTRWAKQVSPANVHSEYPRPQMARKDWLNLNGLWDYAIRPKDESKPPEFDGQILVPFAIESALSGVKKAVGEGNRLWYRRTFEIPKEWASRRILLHFDAVDWDATVWLNGKQVGTHRGGYDAFTFDVTSALNKTGKQEIVLSVWDPTDTGYQPRGKQVRKPDGIWYTAVTGIWQTAWLEPVAPAHIESLKTTPDVDGQAVDIGMNIAYPSGEVAVKVVVLDGNKQVAEGEIKMSGGGTGGVATPCIKLAIKNAKLWSPDSPFLYDLKVTLTHNGKAVDELSSYFGMRKIALGKDDKGVTRMFLNNKPIFQFGPLDQGWWPDGLYTAPTDEALRYDIEVLKRLGCNMMRKHVKVEPDRLYYWCDKLGLLVWQDMPSGDRFIGGNDPDIVRSEESAKQFELELSLVINFLRNHPCIIMWVPFNEGWGQFDTPRIVELIKRLDPTRLVDCASGWTDRGVGDVHDIHSYPGPATPLVEEKRAIVLGEFGGLGIPIKGHTWHDEKSWGYRSFKTSEELTDAYLVLIENLRSLIGGGLCAAVYTQTSDVEVEVNGMMTYDRAMIKMDEGKITAANRRLYLPPPIVKMIVPTSQQEGQNWRYTTSKPADGWEREDFDDSSWQKGAGGFGTKGTPGAVVRTEWNTPDIWIRRTFELKDKKFDKLYLSIHHDEDAEIYINGELAAKMSGFTSNYVRAAISEKARAALKVGSNCLAVHCHQTAGGQYIDVGIVEVKEQTEK
ncbi:MAG: beta galactosidase jelly roll domain-containing protein [Planctomycetota bacterium]|nr:beta galactosidase jelly roll domain-containing protein [Planctomycetota bacterium]